MPGGSLHGSPSGAIPAAAGGALDRKIPASRLPVTFSFPVSGGGITEISRKWCVARCRTSPTGRVRGLHGSRPRARSGAARRGSVRRLTCCLAGSP
jgi:hypothetical protein